MTFDHQEITAALKAWFRPGEVFEVRALEATTKQWDTRPHTEAGYFDLEHPPDLLRSLDTLTAYKGIYVTLNPLTPAVLGRARHVVYDTNFWKSFMAARWLATMGDRASLALWGRDPARHLCYAEHLCAEYRVPTEGRGRKVDEWKLRPEAHDNHWLDCTVGCVVAASLLGVALTCATFVKPRAPTAKLKLSALQRRR